MKVKKITHNKTIYIISDTYYNAKQFANRMKLNLTEWVYVTDHYSLMGLRGEYFAMVGKPWLLDDYNAIVDQLRLSLFIEVESWS